MGINIDPESSTFGKAAGFVLSEENRYLMYIPNTYTYAHGFTVLEDNTELEYLTDNEYSYSDAKSIWYADDSLIDIETSLPIDWTYRGTVSLSSIKSHKNAEAPLLRDSSF